MLFINHPKGSGVPAVINHFSSEKRIELALGRHPEQIGEELIGFLDRMLPFSLQTLFEQRSLIKRFLKAKPRTTSSAISQEISEPPNLDALPIQQCWEKDGGKFITYGQVFTYDPLDGKRNVGIYRMNVFDKATTGMHWQIQKGGGFHYYKSEQAGKDLQLAVALGTDPAMLLATVSPLPEGIDEAMFAGFLSNSRMSFTRGKSISIAVPSDAEFILEGIVPAKERRMEGPFGDHFGHYSAATEFPVFHLKTITHRKNPIYPAIVVGKPPMEDKFLGDATQLMLGRLIKLIHKEVNSLWAYYEAGFHNLLVASVDERYQKESMKAALGMMGTDQLSLTKCIITVSAGVDVRDWNAVVRELRENFDPHFDFVMIPKVPLDTLDFTSYKMNLGSKMILDATRKTGRQRKPAEGDEPFSDIPHLRGICKSIDQRIIDCNLIENTLLLVKVSAHGKTIVEKLLTDPRLQSLKIIAAVSEDVDIFEKESYIWGVFTRFDCERDVIFTDQRLQGISPIYNGIMGIDATWKPGYPEPLAMPEEIVKRVDEKWGKIWK